MPKMPPKAKKASWNEPKPTSDTLIEEKQMGNEKENKSPGLEQKRRRNVRKIYFEETEIEESSKSSTLSKSNAKLKPLGFWSKKLKDLEENEKNKKCELYEFSGTDDSDFSYKKKKRPKPKTKIKKKPAVSKHLQIIEKTGKIPKQETKIKKIHAQSFCKEQIILNKERKKLAERGEKFIFYTGISSLGITSTPEVNKDNLVGASNFLFLSPINKEVEHYKNAKGLTAEPVVNDKNACVVHLGQETPKVETKLKKISCRRVLRSGKMLNT